MGPVAEAESSSERMVQWGKTGARSDPEGRPMHKAGYWRRQESWYSACGSGRESRQEDAGERRESQRGGGSGTQWGQQPEGEGGRRHAGGPPLPSGRREQAQAHRSPILSPLWCHSHTWS